MMRRWLSTAVDRAAVLYREGSAALKKPGAANREIAVDLLQQAAALGHRDAMYDIGMLYVDEKIKVHSNTLPKSMLQGAAAAGHVQAQYALSIEYRMGRLQGISQDLDMCSRYLHMAAGQNHPEALFMLGLHYNSGITVDADPAKAYSLFQRAADLGHLPSSCAAATYLIKDVQKGAIAGADAVTAALEKAKTMLVAAAADEEYEDSAYAWLRYADIVEEENVPVRKLD